MNILVISGSPRAGGNTEIMVEAFAGGAREAGHVVIVKPLSEIKVAPCKACEYCFSHGGVCAQVDGMADILAGIDWADMLVFASPIYWFDMTAQMKAVIDRCYARAQTGFRVTSAALLLDSGSEGVCDAAISQYQGMTGYLHWENKGIFTVSGMSDKGDMANSEKLEEIREFGRSL